MTGYRILLASLNSLVKEAEKDVAIMKTALDSAESNYHVWINTRPTWTKDEVKLCAEAFSAITAAKTACETTESNLRSTSLAIDEALNKFEESK